jgi:primase-polymerase (primpol)-like protein
MDANTTTSRDVSDLFVVPTELKARPQWVCWRYEANPAKPDAKPRKIPYNPTTDTRASSTEAATWAPYAVALDRLRESDRYDGVGYVLSPDDPYTGIDFDGCVAAATRVVEPWAQEWVQRIDSYAEISPSGTGLRIIVRAALPATGRKRGTVEMYDSARFLTITGHHLAGAPTTIAANQQAVSWLHLSTFGNVDGTPIVPLRPQEPAQVLWASDQDLIDKALAGANGAKVAALWAGDTSDYASASEADYALASMFAFYSQDPDELERVMRLSGLNRPKFDQRNGTGTYLSRTIDKLLASDASLGRDTYAPAAAERAEPSQTSPCYEINENNELLTLA